jgi:hypothetical protein
VRLTSAAAILALVVATSLAAGAARATSSPAPAAAPCTASALGEAFNGALELQSMDAWGCVGSFAYAWATVGSGPSEVSVTEVLHVDAASERWVLVSRLTYCHPGTLPDPIYRRGCFSN